MDIRFYIHAVIILLQWDSHFVEVEVEFIISDKSCECAVLIADWFSWLRGSGAFHHHKPHIAVYT